MKMNNIQLTDYHIKVQKPAVLEQNNSKKPGLRTVLLQKMIKYSQMYNVYERNTDNM